MKIQHSPFSWIPLVAFVATAVLIWISYLVLIRCMFGDWSKAGVFGDAFGALSSLFSLLAFAGVLFSLLRDREERASAARIEAYDALLKSIEHQLASAQKSGADDLIVGDLLAKQRLYSEELETLITGVTPQPLLSPEELAEAFSEVPWFQRDDILSRAQEIQKRLMRWSIATPQAVRSLASDSRIRDALSELYVTELQRNANAPFNPDALAVWGGLLLRHGISDDTKSQIKEALRNSAEWRRKYL